MSKAYQRLCQTPPCAWWQYGDGGVDIEPIGDLYITQVRGLSRYKGVPLRIIEKTPTAGLWPGQTDESELGVSYEMADRILTMLVDEKRKISEVKGKFPPEIRSVLKSEKLQSWYECVCK